MKAGKVDRRLLIQGIKDLPTLPIVFREMIDMMEDDTSSAKNLSNLLSKDQSIMSSILKLVNSAFYGFQGKISSINQAIVIMGFNTIRSIALGTSIFNSKGKRKSAGFDRSALWIHSLGVATTAKILAKRTGYKNVDEAFVAGLLHDIGKVVFDAFYPEEFKAVMERVRTEKTLMHLVERDLLDIDHAETAGILLGKWQLPEGVARAVSCHHALSTAPEKYSKLASIISISNRVCCNLGIGSGGDKKVPMLSRAALKALKLSSAKIEALEQEMEENREKIEMFKV